MPVLDGSFEAFVTNLGKYLSLITHLTLPTKRIV